MTRILADESLREGRYVVGANRDGYHLTAWRPERTFAASSWISRWRCRARRVPRCGKPLRVERVIEIGNIFKLGHEVLGGVSARCTSTSKASSSRS